MIRHKFKPHKYGVSAKGARTVDGIVFDSKKEAARYRDLKFAQEKGDIVFFLRQVPFRFADTKYVADFMVFWTDGTVTVEDVKGYRTPEYKAKLRLMRKYYPSITVDEI